MNCKKEIRANQRLLKHFGFDPGPIDGLPGRRTRTAYQDAMGKRDLVGRDTDPELSPNRKIKPVWPRQRDVPKFYGKVGTNQVRLKFPYPMRLAWDTRKVVRSTMCHRKVKDSLERIFKQVLAHYGLKRIKELGLDLYGGCLNVRKMRGGSRWSMHSWGIAVDLDPARNRLRWKKNRARFARPEYLITPLKTRHLDGLRIIDGSCCYCFGIFGSRLPPLPKPTTQTLLSLVT